jgi:TRAP-type C4-dicarboxylate transport system permease small subunit
MGTVTLPAKPAAEAAAPARMLALIDRHGERFALLFFYALIISTVVVDVIRRFVFSYSSVWGEEVARYAFIYLTWIAAAAAVRDRAHIRIDAISRFMPTRVRAGLYLFGEVATLVLAVISLKLSLEPVLVSLDYGSVTPGLRISQAWFLAAVPLGFTLVVIRVLQAMWRDVTDWIEGREPFEGHKLFD